MPWEWIPVSGSGKPCLIKYWKEARSFECREVVGGPGYCITEMDLFLRELARLSLISASIVLVERS